MAIVIMMNRKKSEHCRKSYMSRSRWMDGHTHPQFDPGDHRSPSYLDSRNVCSDCDRDLYFAQSCIECVVGCGYKMQHLAYVRAVSVFTEKLL